jgi:hypothetical protein
VPVYREVNEQGADGARRWARTIRPRGSGRCRRGGPASSTDREVVRRARLRRGSGERERRRESAGSERERARVERGRELGQASYRARAKRRGRRGEVAGGFNHRH